MAQSLTDAELGISREWRAGYDAGCKATFEEVRRHQDRMGHESIQVEKKMLACLGREWIPTGISVYSLVDDMIAEVERLRQIIRNNCNGDVVQLALKTRNQE